MAHGRHQKKRQLYKYVTCFKLWFQVVVPGVGVLSTSAAAVSMFLGPRFTSHFSFVPAGKFTADCIGHTNGIRKRASRKVSPREN
jgi:hypothetical protein